MIKTIRTSKASKIIASYLALMIFLEITAPMCAYALTGGPSQPEFESFTPIGTSDMVDLSSGDFSYNIPIMDVGGYPINLAYNSNITMDQEASWVGLGWDLNVGQISRQLRGLPDDFSGDEMFYENNMKKNVTVGANFNVFSTLFGAENTPVQGVGESPTPPPPPPPPVEGETPAAPESGSPFNGSIGFGTTFNNYDGFGFTVTAGLSYQISNNLSVGMNMDSKEGVSVSPSVSFYEKAMSGQKRDIELTSSIGTTLSSRRGIETVTLSETRKVTKSSKGKSLSGISGSVSFADATFTPSKRVGMISNNMTFNLNIEGEFWGTEPGGLKFTGYRTTQGIRDTEKQKIEKAYGYENTYNATDDNILDFNREKDRTFSSGSTSIPVTNSTYDLYSIQGQGISGMFRPYKGQVGYVYDNHTEDNSNGQSGGVELGVGGGAHWGANIGITTAKSSTMIWRGTNYAIPKLEEKKSGNRPDYEKVFFKNIGGFHVDNEYSLLKEKMGNYDPVRFEIGGSPFSRTVEQHFRKKGSASSLININTPLKREKRLSRNQAIEKLSRAQAADYGIATDFSPYCVEGKHDHHTAEIRIVKDGGERYVYGRAAYNVVKKEATFDISGRPGDCQTGLVSYNPGSDNSINNNARGDQYFNRITTPAYAHSYLLTAVLSSDYSDLTNNGLTDDDLGSYTKFSYDAKTNDNLYKWRIPFAKKKANYDEGLKTSKGDDKANYLYGEKEILYIKKIETKTHIAIFDISLREDGYGVDNEDGGGTRTGTTSRMYKLDKIRLYSKPEYLAKGDDAIPIKVAHFKYNYYLCQGVDNNLGTKDRSELNNPKFTGNQGGKLTLQKVYFTYRDSNMGKYTPYSFNYGNNLNSPYENPAYDMKAYDIWGNFKPNAETTGCGIYQDLSNAEFPYVDQNKETADQYATAWLMRSIDLPSGGRIEIEFESDDYRYVQDKEVMQMYQVTGVGKSTDALPTTLNGVRNTTLFNSMSDEKDVLYVQLPAGTDIDNTEVGRSKFKDRYIRNLADEAIYFRFLLNMSKPNTGAGQLYDYVTGYFERGQNLQGDIDYRITNVIEGHRYAAIPVKLVNKGDGLNADGNVNPISKAGWNFGRQYLHKYVYDGNTDESTDNVEEIIMEILNSVPDLLDMFKSPNRQLIDKKIASEFISGKSWIRLMAPDRIKYGGGNRVKQIIMHDRWDVMANHTDDDNYKQFYGQQYTYETKEGGKVVSSGVAAYEPIGDKENPFVQPFYDKKEGGKLLAPESRNYIELPFGECFFPAPKITYSKVTVKNLPRQIQEGSQTFEVKKHATGSVVTEFYTSRDYPTIVDYTDLKASYDRSHPLAQIINLNVKDHITLSQGFTLHTNDMDGKMKATRVYAEGQTAAISGADYIYSEQTGQHTSGFNRNQGKLNNAVTTIDAEGNIVNDNLVGVDYDIINDFRQNTSVTESGSINVNTAFLPIIIGALIIPTPIPTYSRHDNTIKMAVTTKVIHTSGILREQKVYDAGSSVYTRNLAWDAETGEVLLTETVNEYNDKYYSFNFPAYWAYKAMGQTAKNVGLSWKLRPVFGTQDKFRLSGVHKASDYLMEGDEIWVKLPTEEFKAYVAAIDNTKFTLITSEGTSIKTMGISEADFTIVRSGFRNMQAASMASVTSMLNPLYNGTTALTKLPANLFSTETWGNYRIVNASAIAYSDEWPAQCECRLPRMQFDANGKLKFDYDDQLLAYNPYKYNVKGNWRPKISYAYLTGRNSEENASTRQSGFFKDFIPYYIYNEDLKKWTPNSDLNLQKWTYASEVSQYNPYGFELENRDALERFSSALYGYNYRFPVAVAANTRYRELAYDGFEDYDFNVCDTTSHFSYQGDIKPNKVTISSVQAHSGRKSLKVAPNNKATIKKRIVPCPATPGAP
ncbi:hypothetical protein AAEO56_11715 [Flavobacterium sp. DGU11]|uniref:PA14 domain-containing protein n=1 Tax=Flavobacterium arundinis TaxID=3139143 RepID=A0ABU9HXR3_9FLAO